MQNIKYILYSTYNFNLSRLQAIEAEFDKHVSLSHITSQQLDVDIDTIAHIYNYWKLKRRVSIFKNDNFIFLLVV